MNKSIEESQALCQEIQDLEASGELKQLNSCSLMELYSKVDSLLEKLDENNKADLRKLLKIIVSEMKPKMVFYCFFLI